MPQYYKNIREALINERPTDKIVSILSNKYAIVQSLYTNGVYSEPSICGLDKNKIYFYGNIYRDNTWKNLKAYIVNKVLTMPNHENRMTGYNHIKEYVLKSVNNKRYKKNYRKILKFI
jgi:hypothetical protein